MTPPSSTSSYDANLYKCPHCGALKFLRLAYGYDFDSVVRWSDTKKYYPQIQKPSYVQRCPACKKYYFKDDETLYKTDIHCTCDVAWGRLTYQSLRDAFEQLSPKGKDEKQIRMMLLHAHNDLYGGCEEAKPRAEASIEEQQFFEENVQALILMANINDPYDRLLMAELYREMGRFEEAIRILREPFDYNLYLNLDAIRKQILKQAEKHSTNVFIVDGDKNHKRDAVLVDDKDYLYDDYFEKNYIDKDYLPF